MLKTDDIIAEIMSLPVDMRAQIIDKLLQGLNPSQKKIDDIWATEAERRVDEIERGDIETKPGDEVFKNIKNRFRP